MSTIRYYPNLDKNTFDEQLETATSRTRPIGFNGREFVYLEGLSLLWQNIKYHLFGRESYVSPQRLKAGRIALISAGIKKNLLTTSQKTQLLRGILEPEIKTLLQTTDSAKEDKSDTASRDVSPESPVSSSSPSTPRVPIERMELDDERSITFDPSTRQYTLLTPAPKIKNVVFAGGGAKGVLLLGVVQALEERIWGRSVREGLDHVAGSSIGAITASLVAAGMPAKRLIQAMRKVDFADLKGKRAWLHMKDGKPLFDFVHEYTKKSIHHNLKKIFRVDHLRDVTDGMILKYLQKKKISDPTIIAEITSAVHLLQGDKKGEIPVTFGLLRTLHHLHPRYFKELTVTATCSENGEVFYFDADRTPLLDIATAARASAALPIVLTPVTIDRKLLSPGYDHMLPDKTTMTFRDGGMFDNTPVDPMESKQGGIATRGEEGQNLHTLVVLFDDTETSEGAPSPFHEEVAKPLVRYPSTARQKAAYQAGYRFAQRFAGVVTERDYLEVLERNLDRIRRMYMQRSIPIRTDLGTVDFVKAKRDEERYRETGYRQTMEYMHAHRGELVARRALIPEELLGYLSDEDEEGQRKILEFAARMKEQFPLLPLPAAAAAAAAVAAPPEEETP